MVRSKNSLSSKPSNKGKNKNIPIRNSKINNNFSIFTQESECTHYQIKVGWIEGSYLARAFLKRPITLRGIVAEASGATQEKAIEALNKVIKDRNSRWAAKRRVDTRTGMTIPSSEEYADAIHQAILTIPQRSMLLALAEAGTEGLSEIKLAQSAGYKSISYATRSMEKITFTLATCLSASNLDSVGTLGDNESCTILGVCNVTDPEKLTETWVLHSELREAVLEDRHRSFI